MTISRDWLSPKVEIVFCYLPPFPELMLDVPRFLEMSRVIFVSVLSATQETRGALATCSNLCWGEHDNYIVVCAWFAC